MAVVRKRYGATDGWIKMPDGTTHYIFGYNDITDIPEDKIFEYSGKGDFISPLLDVYEGDEIYLTLTNLGFPQRPDLDDPHTIHWHGFPNQIPLWDGIPEVSVSVPIGRDFDYYYKPLDPGTYVYHCHFEPVEHIQMGMLGPLTVRPLLEKDTEYSGRKFAYNDLSTEYEREALIFLTEIDERPHKIMSFGHGFDWTEYNPQYRQISGRSYPDTTMPANDPNLKFQPYSSKVEANPGERVLLRFVNLGFESQTMQLLGIQFKVIGMDAKQLKGINGEDLSYWTNAIDISPGQTVDAIFTAPRKGKYIIYNRGHYKNTNKGSSFGGMITEISVIR